MSSELDGLRGSQRPTFETRPPSSSSGGAEAIELAESAGLILDPWQRHAVEVILAERPGRKWAAFECGVIVPRQNGKGAILEAIELAGLFLLGESLIIHSAHEFKTAAEAFLRIKSLIESTPDLLRQVRHFRTAHGAEAIELNDGRRLRFLARSRGSARGFTADRIVLDECYDLPPVAMAAMLPTLSAAPNPQIIYTTSTPPEVDDKSLHIRRARTRAHSDDPGLLAWLEWSAEPDDDQADPQTWARTNPGLGIRVSAEFVQNQLAAEPDSFGVERLGIWPAEGDEGRLISAELWDAGIDANSEALDPVAMAVDVTPNRRFSSVAIAGFRSDGLPHVEVIEHRPEVRWVVNYVASRVATLNPTTVVVDPAGPAGSLIVDLTAAGVPVTQSKPRDMAQACGMFYDAVAEGRLRHRGQPILTAAVAMADTRPLSDAWAWSRKSKSDISPLVAVTLALSAARQPVMSIDAAANVW